MRNLIRNTTVIFLFLISWNNVLVAQENADIRIVYQALQMITFPEPEFEKPYASNLNPKEIADLGFEQPNQSKSITFKMKDGVRIHGQKFEFSSKITVLLLHGVLANSYTYNKMAGLLREALQAEVIAIDLRGHGQSEGVPGDISTLNQYAEDLDDIISSVKIEKPDQTILLAGHSMGGGIVLRYTETFQQNRINGYLLFAPNLGNNAPTTNQNLDLENNFIKTHLSRGLGLRMLNELGIHKYDSLKVVFYNLPEQMPLRSYSYRSMQASFPNDYKEALRSIDKPMLVIIGSDDEAFIAKEYPPIFETWSNGKCYIIEGETHNGIRHNAEAMVKVRNWAVKNQLR